MKLSNRMKMSLAMVLGVGASFVFSVSAMAETTKITFLHTNDVYEISPKGGQGGLAELKALIGAEMAKSPNTVVTFGGDLFSPSLLSAVTKGAHMVDLYNQLETDFAVPGNHEFDFGPDIAAQRFSESKFKWLASNASKADGSAAWGLTEKAAIVEFNGVKVGVIGILNPETGTLSSPGEDIVFDDPIETATSLAAQLKSEGADVVVALSHLALGQDIELLESVDDIDLVLSGHDHVPAIYYSSDRLMAEAGYDAQQLLAVDMFVDKTEKDGKTRVSVRFDWRATSTAGVTPDAGIAAQVAKYNEELDASMSKEVGVTNTMLDSTKSVVRGQESAIGNLITDAMRTSTNADIAITNGGGIRANRTYDPGTTLIRGDILKELPFGNVTVLLEVSGDVVMQALENGVSQVEDGAGRFPQVSGLTFAYSPSAPAGSRVSDVMVNGAPLDPEESYTLATNDYMAGGGDGYDMLRDAFVLIDASGGTLMATTVMEYVSAAGSVSPAIEGRITAR